MPSLLFLGTANALPSAQRENTHLFLKCGQHNILIDCSGNPFARLEQVGASPLEITDVILTHFHPDHVSGVPSLLMGLWLMGYQREMHIYGLAHTLDRLYALMEGYGWDNWPGFFPIAFHRLPSRENVVLLEDADLRILSSPVRHIIPAIGLRMELRQGGKVIAYSGDTEPCQEMIRLAAGADVLIHEAGGEFFGHSSAAQAAEVARQAEVGALYLVHYPALTPAMRDQMLSEAAQRFAGPIYLAEDLMRLEF